MKCKVCGAESGKYPLCKSCNLKKEQGKIIKCEVCGNWHYASQPCPSSEVDESQDGYVYNKKTTLITKSEQGYFSAIKEGVPSDYFVFPQINLASFIEKVDDSKFRNELFRNVDFLITDGNYVPRIVIEINDMSHNSTDRKERDEKVKNICEEAGIPIITLWTSYGINQSYINEKIAEALDAPTKRVHHFKLNRPAKSSSKEDNDSYEVKKQGCYIATCVYGSYDCPEVWTLRRFRDDTLSKTWYGRLFIRVYYAISPTIIKWFGHPKWFKMFWRGRLDNLVNKLHSKGVEDTPYSDKY